MELNVEGGKLLLCMSDLEAVRDTPEGLQFYAVLLAYMNSSDFKPSTSLSVESFKNLFEAGVRKEERNRKKADFTILLSFCTQFANVNLTSGYLCDRK